MTNYQRQQYLHDQIRKWHATDVKNDRPPSQEDNFIWAVAVAFCAGIACTFLLILVLSLGD